MFGSPTGRFVIRHFIVVSRLTRARRRLRDVASSRRQAQSLRDSWHETKRILFSPSIVIASNNILCRIRLSNLMEFIQGLVCFATGYILKAWLSLWLSGTSVGSRAGRPDWTSWDERPFCPTVRLSDCPPGRSKSFTSCPLPRCPALLTTAFRTRLTDTTTRGEVPLLELAGPAVFPSFPLSLIDFRIRLTQTININHSQLTAMQLLVSSHSYHLELRLHHYARGLALLAPRHGQSELSSHPTN